MKSKKILSLLTALLMLCGSLFGTSAFAVTETQTVPASQATTATTAESENQKSFGKQALILLAFAAGVGILAALYGVINMRYNAEKMDDMSEVARNKIKKMRDDP